MKLLDLLVCPHCKGSLAAEIYKEDEFGINEGRLQCEACAKEFPVKNGVFYFLEELESSLDINPDTWSRESIENYHRRVGEWHSLTDWYEKFGMPKEVGEFRYQRIQKRMIDSMKVNDGDIIFDDGCGIGYFLFDILQAYPQRQLICVGLDVSVHNIEGLNRRRRREGITNIFGIVGNAQELPFKNKAFDVVTSVEALEHFEEPGIAIDEIYRVLKPKGRLFLSTPSKRALNILKKPFKFIEEPVKRILDKRRNLEQTGYDYYDNPLYPEELTNLLKKHSFVILNFIRTNILFPGSFYALLPLKLTRLMLRISSLIENKMLRLFLPLTNSCVVECYKQNNKKNA